VVQEIADHQGVEGFCGAREHGKEEAKISHRTSRKRSRSRRVARNEMEQM